jgi:hypothetical protein
MYTIHTTVHLSFQGGWLGLGVPFAQHFVMTVAGGTCIGSPVSGNEDTGGALGRSHLHQMQILQGLLDSSLKSWQDTNLSQRSGSVLEG